MKWMVVLWLITENYAVPLAYHENQLTCSRDMVVANHYLNRQPRAAIAKVMCVSSVVTEPAPPPPAPPARWTPFKKYDFPI